MCYYFTTRHHHKQDKKRFFRYQFTIAVCIIISYMGSANNMFMCMGFRTTNVAFSRSTTTIIPKRRSHHRYCTYNRQKSKANHNNNIARYLSSKVTSNNNKSDDYRDHTTTAPTSAKGVTHSSSDFVTHFIAGPDNTLTTLQAIGKVMNKKSPSLSSMEEQDNDEIVYSTERQNDEMNNDDDGEVVAVAVNRDNFNLTPAQLLALGSVWFLPVDAPRDPSLGGKPKRLTLQDATRILEEGDYLRVHHTPRRFPAVYDFSWNREASDGDNDPVDNNIGAASSSSSDNMKPSVIVASDSDKGYIVINKPAGVPVHCTVDNALENVADCLRTSLTKEMAKKNVNKHVNGDDSITTTRTPTKTKRKRSQKGKAKDSDNGVYVSTPQRLDQNTSGLLVVATRKVFASYYAKILRHKTGKQLVVSSQEYNDSSNNNNNDTSRQGGIHKEYRCLVCINEPQQKDDDNVIEKEREDSSSLSPPSWSVLGALETLKNYASDQTIIRHYLEPSIRAPKNFARIPGNESWAESLLRIKNVGDLHPLVGSKANDDLANSLWVHPEAVPKECKAIVELEIELLTGRTHQIRGQLSAEGFPLVGDAQYGGAIPLNTPVTSTALEKNDDNEAMKSQSLPYGYARFDKLALQCSQLEFLDPDIVLKDDGTEVGSISDRWNVFRLEDAWWTPHLTDHQQQMASLVSSSSYPEGEAASTDASDEELVRALKDASPSPTVIEEERSGEITSPLPSNILLAPGVHKYILLKATKYPSSTEDEGSETEVQWFVKSASPAECGGPYHANVAQSLVNELQCKGYDVTVTGGGRIDYNNDEYAPHAHVYGFSYGFGKGDHAKAASLIESYSNNTVIATYDNSNTLY